MNIRDYENNKPLKPHKWISIDNVIKIIMRSKNHNDITWTWFKNQRCRYINLTIDMNDSKCLLRDKKDHPISLEELRYQHDRDIPNT